MRTGDRVHVLITVELRLTGPSLISPPRSYSHFFVLAKYNTFSYKKFPLIRQTPHILKFQLVKSVIIRPLKIVTLIL